MSLLKQMNGQLQFSVKYCLCYTDSQIWMKYSRRHDTGARSRPDKAMQEKQFEDPLIEAQSVVEFFNGG